MATLKQATDSIAASAAALQGHHSKIPPQLKSAIILSAEDLDDFLKIALREVGVEGDGGEG